MRIKVFRLLVEAGEGGLNVVEWQPSWAPGVDPGTSSIDA